jgi:hypothetical protein
MIKFLEILFPHKPAEPEADDSVHHMVRLTDKKPVCTIFEPNDDNVGFVHFAGGDEFKKPMCIDCGVVLDYLNGKALGEIEDPHLPTKRDLEPLWEEERRGRLGYY